MHFVKGLLTLWERGEAEGESRERGRGRERENNRLIGVFPHKCLAVLGTAESNCIYTTKAKRLLSFSRIVKFGCKGPSLHVEPIPVISRNMIK